MGAAAELDGHIAHLHHPDGVAVFFTEHSHGALFLGLLNGQHLRHHGIALQDGVVDQLLHLMQLVRGDGLKVGEVEAQPVRLHQGARLVHVVAQHLFQGRIQQMGGAVCPADGLAALGVDGGVYGVTHMERALCQLPVVHEFAALILLHVRHGEQHARGADGAVVGHLAAHLRIEGRLVQHHHGVGPGGDLAPQLVLGHQSHHRGVELIVVIAHELRGRDVLAELHAGPAQVAQGLPGLPGPLLLLLHQLPEALLVHGHALLGHHLRRQVDGEAKGVIQPEGVRTGKHLLALGLVLGQQVGEDLHAAVDGAAEILLLGADDLGDIRLLFPQIRILSLVFMDHGVHHLIQERLIDAQELPMAGGPAQQPPQHIAPALVGGKDAVADHKRGRADVIGDDPQGHIPLFRLAVVSAGELGHLVGDVHHGVHVEQALHILAHAGQTLQPHAGVDVLLLQLGIVALAVVVELGEHVVPDFNVPVAVAAHGAPGLAAAVLGAAVIVDLGAGAAGAGAVLPEVVLLAEAENALLGNADLLVPDVEGLVIVQIDGGIQPVGLQAHPLGAGQKFPAPGNGLMLEIVAEGEVAQHLEVGAVAGGLAHVVDVAGADALLAGAYPVAGGLLLTLEPGLHGGHAGIDEQDGFVVLGHQGKAGQPQMVLGFKEPQEHLPQFIQAVIGMGHGSLLLHFKCILLIFFCGAQGGDLFLQGPVKPGNVPPIRQGVVDLDGYRQLGHATAHEQLPPADPDVAVRRSAGRVGQSRIVQPRQAGGKDAGAFRPAVRFDGAALPGRCLLHASHGDVVLIGHPGRLHPAIGIAAVWLQLGEGNRTFVVLYHLAVLNAPPQLRHPVHRPVNDIQHGQKDRLVLRPQPQLQSRHIQLHRYPGVGEGVAAEQLKLLPAGVTVHRDHTSLHIRLLKHKNAPPHIGAKRCFTVPP